MNEQKMKPAFCPFCKCADSRVSVRRQGKSGYRVVCGRCGASGPYAKIGDRPKLEAQAEAVRRWNSRWETTT